MLPGWRLRRWRRRRAMSALLLLVVIALAFAVCVRRTEIVPRALSPDALVALVA